MSKVPVLVEYETGEILGVARDEHYKAEATSILVDSGRKLILAHGYLSYIERDPNNTCGAVKLGAGA